MDTPPPASILPENLKKQLLARGVQGVRDEVQDMLYMVLKLACSGAAEEKMSPLKHLQDPTPCSKAESALNEIQRFWATARRVRALGMSFPDVTVLYTAFRSICSNVFTNAGDNLRLRWMQLENDFGLPQVVTFDAMQRAAQFA